MLWRPQIALLRSARDCAQEYRHAAHINQEDLAAVCCVKRRIIARARLPGQQQNRHRAAAPPPTLSRAPSELITDPTYLESFFLGILSKAAATSTSTNRWQLTNFVHLLSTWHRTDHGQPAAALQIYLREGLDKGL